MEALFVKHDRLIANTSTEIVREMMNRVNWNAGLLSIQGAKGIGKSTLLKQFVKLNYQTGDRSVLYCSADTVDMSRRCVRYDMSGLSFREALKFYEGLDFPIYKLEDILANPFELWEKVSSKCKPVERFKKYLKSGYYSFYLEGKEDYSTKIEQIVNYVIEVELPLICKVEAANIRKIKALMSVISESVPYEVNTNRLAVAIEIGRDTVIRYLKNLGDANLLNLLYSDKKSIGKLTKPDKVYLENTNLLYALSPSSVEIETARETFAIAHLAENHSVEYGKDKGDFKVDSKYHFEIGGKDKGFGQIADISDSYIFADDIESPVGAKLPLWMLGFLY